MSARTPLRTPPFRAPARDASPGTTCTRTAKYDAKLRCLPSGTRRGMRRAKPACETTRSLTFWTRR